MKKLIFLMISLSLLFLIGCGSMHAPMAIPTITNLQISESNYEILSDQEVTGTSSFGKFLFFFGGDAGLKEAYKDALSKYAGANTLINARIDVKYTSFLVWEQYTTEVTGFPARIKINKK
jgi:hypothetical protein